MMHAGLEDGDGNEHGWGQGERVADEDASLVVGACSIGVVCSPWGSPKSMPLPCTLAAVSFQSSVVATNLSS